MYYYSSFLTIRFYIGVTIDSSNLSLVGTANCVLVGAQIEFSFCGISPFIKPRTQSKALFSTFTLLLSFRRSFSIRLTNKLPNFKIDNTYYKLIIIIIRDQLKLSSTCNMTQPANHLQTSILSALSFSFECPTPKPKHTVQKQYVLQRRRF